MDADRVQFLKSLATDKWPFSIARSPALTTDLSERLLHILLILDHDEIPNYSAESVEQYVCNRGRRRNKGRNLAPDGTTQRAFWFWFYPTGLLGPYRELTDDDTGEERLEKHGLLVTVEEGAQVQDVVRGAMDGLVMGELRHTHIAAPSSSSTGTQGLLDILFNLGVPVVPDSDDFAHVEQLVRTEGRRTEDDLPRDGRLDRSLMLWVYPTTLGEPGSQSMETAAGSETITRHGLLLTCEEGALVQDVVQAARAGLVGLVLGDLRHDHVPARWID